MLPFAGVQVPLAGAHVLPLAGAHVPPLAGAHVLPLTAPHLLAAQDEPCVLDAVAYAAGTITAADKVVSKAATAKDDFFMI